MKIISSIVNFIEKKIDNNSAKHELFDKYSEVASEPIMKFIDKEKVDMFMLICTESFGCKLYRTSKDNTDCNKYSVLISKVFGLSDTLIKKTAVKSSANIITLEYNGGVINILPIKEYRVIFLCDSGSDSIQGSLTIKLKKLAIEISKLIDNRVSPIRTGAK